uniref:Reverse transcriptase domain-containing protein n=1 Tax=Cannabis sativa TaxID=3483 RepID=A0A803NLW2_CANSA
MHWNRAQYGKINSIISDLERRLNLIQSLLTGSREWATERDIRQSLNEARVRKELYWKQRARVSWLKKGDKCTKFFFLSATMKGRRNAIESILNKDNLWVTSRELIRNEFMEFFKGIFTRMDSGYNLNCNYLIKDRISEGDQAELIRYPDDEEIKCTLFTMGNNKAPGPDGRNIQDNNVIAQEIIHSFNKKNGKEGMFAIKIDLMKAYDRLSWSFIDHVLSCFGAPSDLRRWISQCITTTTLSVCLNGGPCGKITPSCGLRQGDSLSPYLFIWAAEILSRLLEEAQQKKIINGIRLNKGCLIISHIFFADDLILVGKAKLEEVKEYWDCLEKFVLGRARKSINLRRRFSSPRTLPIA